MTVQTSDYKPPMRQGVHPFKVAPPLTPAPPLQPELRVLEDGKTLFEKDVAIPMRDGVRLYANVFRPVDKIAGETPSIIYFSPFGKHGAVPTAFFKNMGVDFDKLSKYTLWELPDPLVWAGKYGYSLIIVDTRATWWSEGEAAYYFSPEEGRDGFDIVEWVAKQPWCTGKVGWGAVSYFAMSTYQMAVLKPPSLAAVLPWEAASDIYREINTIGGIPGAPFQHFWMNLTGNGLARNEDHGTLILEHPVFDELWASKVPDWSKIDVPAFSVTGWSSVSIHLHGTIAAWNAFKSDYKYLWVHNQREWEAFYSEEGQRRQKAFWDRHLKGIASEVDQWEKVEVEARYTINKSETRFDVSWPPAKVRLTSFALGPNGNLVLGGTVSTAGTDESPTTSSHVAYVAHQSESRAQWEYTFEERTEITGDASLKLFVQATHAPDADLFVAVQKIGLDGEEEKFYTHSQKQEASAAHGWLRLSHREKDVEASVAGRPVHTHKRRLWVGPSEINEVEVEIWPTSTIWEKGETLRLVVKGSSFFDDGSFATTKNFGRHSFGEVKIWFGGRYDSNLLLPILRD